MHTLDLQVGIFVQYPIGSASKSMCVGFTPNILKVNQSSSFKKSWNRLYNFGALVFKKTNEILGACSMVLSSHALVHGSMPAMYPGRKGSLPSPFWSMPF